MWGDLPRSVTVHSATTVPANGSTSSTTGTGRRPRIRCDPDDRHPHRVARPDRRTRSRTLGRPRPGRVTCRFPVAMGFRRCTRNMRYSDRKLGKARRRASGRSSTRRDSLGLGVEIALLREAGGQSGRRGCSRAPLPVGPRPSRAGGHARRTYGGGVASPGRRAACRRWPGRARGQGHRDRHGLVQRDGRAGRSRSEHLVEHADLEPVGVLPGRRFGMNRRDRGLELEPAHVPPREHPLENAHLRRSVRCPTAAGPGPRVRIRSPTSSVRAVCRAWVSSSRRASHLVVVRKRLLELAGQAHGLIGQRGVDQGVPGPVYPSLNTRWSTSRTAATRSGRSASSGASKCAPAAWRALARLGRWAMVGSGTRNAAAIWAAVSPRPRAGSARPARGGSVPDGSTAEAATNCRRPHRLHRDRFPARCTRRRAAPRRQPPRGRSGRGSNASDRSAAERPPG